MAPLDTFQMSQLTPCFPLYILTLTGEIAAIALDAFGQSEESCHVGFELVQKLFLIGERKAIPFDEFIGE
jgi:hypothetical protein